MKSSLQRDLKITDPDDFYDQLIELHRELDAAQSQVANAKLVLLLANHIGDRQVLDEAIAAVASSVHKN